MFILAISLFLTLAVPTLTLATNKLMFNYDMKGSYQSAEGFWQGNNDDTTFDTDSGYVIGYEYTNNNQRAELGFGIESQLERNLTNYEDAGFEFTTLYGVMYFHIVNKKDFAPFLVGRIGYNWYTGNDTYKNTVYGLDAELNDGLYGAIGFGFNAERSLATFLYSINCGSLSSSSDFDFNRYIVYSKFSIVFGFKF